VGIGVQMSLLFYLKYPMGRFTNKPTTLEADYIGSRTNPLHLKMDYMRNMPTLVSL
jgi:hypothetical protein